MLCCGEFRESVMKKIRPVASRVTAESAFYAAPTGAKSIRHQRGRLILTLNGAGRSLQIGLRGNGSACR